MKRISLIMILFFSATLFLAYNVDNVYAKTKQKHHHTKSSKKHARKSLSGGNPSRKLAGGESDYKVGANIIGVADDNYKEFTYIDMGSTQGVKNGDRFLVQGKYGKIMVEVVQAFSKMSSVRVVDSWLLAEGDKASFVPESMYPRVKVKKYDIVELTKPRHKKLAKKKKAGPAVSAQSVVAPAVPGGSAAPPAAPGMEAPPGMEMPAPSVPEAGAVPEAPGAPAATSTAGAQPPAPDMGTQGLPGMEAPTGMETTEPPAQANAGATKAKSNANSTPPAPPATEPGPPGAAPVPPDLSGPPVPDSTGGANVPAAGEALPPLQ